MKDHSDNGAGSFKDGNRRTETTEKPDAPVFIATGIVYAANLAALVLLARRFLHHEAFDGASAWSFIALSGLAAAIVCALILRARGKRRTREGRGRWNWQGA